MATENTGNGRNELLNEMGLTEREHRRRERRNLRNSMLGAGVSVVLCFGTYASNLFMDRPEAPKGYQERVAQVRSFEEMERRAESIEGIIEKLPAHLQARLETTVSEIKEYSAKNRPQLTEEDLTYEKENEVLSRKVEDRFILGMLTGVGGIVVTALGTIYMNSRLGERRFDIPQDEYERRK